MFKLIDDTCPEPWKAFIQFHKQTVSVAEDDFIIQEGDPVQGLYWIVEGKAKVISGHESSYRLLRLAGAGDLIGHRGFGGDWRYPVSAMALVPTTLDFLPLTAFEVLAKANPNFTYRLMMFFAEELRETERKTDTWTVLRRIAHTLMLNMQAFGLDEQTKLLNYTISRKDIASHAVTTYETVIRTLSDLSKQKVISIQGKKIAILKVNALNDLAAGESV